MRNEQPSSCRECKQCIKHDVKIPINKHLRLMSSGIAFLACRCVWPGRIPPETETETSPVDKPAFQVPLLDDISSAQWYETEKETDMKTLVSGWGLNATQLSKPCSCHNSIFSLFTCFSVLFSLLIHVHSQPCLISGNRRRNSLKCVGLEKGRGTQVD